MKKNCLIILLPALFLLLFTSCSKGYEVNFTNYYIEPIDSVIVGNNLVMFTNIDVETTSEYKKIGKGNHSIKCISRSKKTFYSTIHIAGTGSGKFNIQIDGIQQISILEN